MDNDNVNPGDLQEQIGELEAALDQLKSMVSRLPSDPTKHQDVTRKLDVGDELKAVIEDPGEGTRHGDPMARIDGVVTFLKQPAKVDVDRGDTVFVTITDTAESHAKGVITNTLEDSNE